MNEIYIGDTILKHIKSMQTTWYVFNGARKVDDKWHITFTHIFTAGYAGGSTSIIWQVDEGEKLRLSSFMKGVIYNDNGIKRKSRDEKVSAIQFVKIEKDLLQIYFDLA